MNLYFLSLVIILLVFIITFYYEKYKIRNNFTENFALAMEMSKKMNLFKDCYTLDKVYDRFYCDIYNDLFSSPYKNQYETLQLREYIFKKWEDPVKILDLGCGNGHHVDLFNQYKYDATGIDISKYMIQNCKKNYPLYNFIQGDFMEVSQFEPKSFSHITCFFYTVYYVEELELLFKNVNTWLKTNGVFVVHLVDKRKFDPVLERSSGLIPLYNPQKHERKTKTELVFNNFVYNSDWILDKHPSSFIEIFKFKDGNTRKNTHTFYLYPMKKFVKTANNQGFKLVQTIDLAIANHPFNYLFCFKKKFG